MSAPLVLVDDMLALYPTADQAEGQETPALNAANGLDCCCGDDGTCTDCCPQYYPDCCFVSGDPGDVLTRANMTFEFYKYHRIKQCPDSPAACDLFDPDDEPTDVSYEGWSVDVDSGAVIANTIFGCGFDQTARVADRFYEFLFNCDNPVVTDNRRVRNDVAFTFAQLSANPSGNRHWIVVVDTQGYGSVQFITGYDDRGMQSQNWSAVSELNARIGELPQHECSGADYTIDTGCVAVVVDGRETGTHERIIYTVSVGVNLTNSRCNTTCTGCLP